MKKLTSRQERRIMATVMKNIKMFGNGSSRVVVPFGKDKVVKIALCQSGKNQNNNEIYLFKNHSNELSLAKIFSYSENIIIMERLYDTFEYFENNKFSFINSDNEFEYYYHEYGERVELQVDSTIEMLECHWGETTDNWQLGVDKKGNVKSYDYGFDTNGINQVGYLRDYNNKDIKQKVLELKLSL